MFEHKVYFLYVCSLKHKQHLHCYMPEKSLCIYIYTHVYMHTNTHTKYSKEISIELVLNWPQKKYIGLCLTLSSQKTFCVM